METIILNILLLGIILISTSWGFYKVIKAGYGSYEYDQISEKKSETTNHLSVNAYFKIYDDLEKKVDVIDANQRILERCLEEIENKLETKIKENYELTVDPFESTIDYKSMYKKPDYKDAEAIRRNTRQIPGELNKDWNKRKKQAYFDAREWNDEQDRLQNEFVSQKKVEEITMKLETMKLQNENLKLQRKNK